MKKINPSDASKVLGGASIEPTTLMAGGEEDMPVPTSAMVGEEEPSTMATGEEDTCQGSKKQNPKSPTGKF